jgi:hypothetical protein
VCLLSRGVLLSLDLLEVWPIATACSRERRLSEYVRAGAREELLRGIEKIRKVVKPSASPRVGANLEAILNDRVVDVQWYETTCGWDSQAIMIDTVRLRWRSNPMQPSKSVVCCILGAVD